MIVVMDDLAPVHIASPPLLNEELTITVGLHNQGIQFGLSAQGEEILSVLL